MVTRRKNELFKHLKDYCSPGHSPHWPTGAGEARRGARLYWPARNRARGISEIRAIFGGLFIGLGLAPLFLGAAAFTMLGVGYLAIAVVRAFSISFDKSYDRSNWISLVIEVVLGVILVIPSSGA